MKNYTFFALGLLLVGCGSVSPILSTPIENIDKRPLKLTPLKEKDLQRWSHLDFTKDTVPGMSVDLTYQKLLKGKKGKKVIVGVVDSGIDIKHEDLKSAIWKNPKEIPNNKIDDDGNGYVDDINGWNFLGGCINEQLEKTRIVKNGPNTPFYAEAKAEVDKELEEALGTKKTIDQIINADKALRNGMNKPNYTKEELVKFETKDERLLQYKQAILGMIGGTTKAEFDKEIKEASEHVYEQVNYNLNVNYDGRKIVGDNPNDMNDKKYGDNNVIGPDPDAAKHGTHVAGIIAQVRGNGKGGDGVCSNAEIMAIRAVPNGDEYDKDIALGIRYAVNNGAKVINGSFGKYFSPNKEWVLDALKYAASKDVLVIFAAGNESTDLDTKNKYPMDSYDNQPENIDNVIMVGALSNEYGSKMVASFSNFGKNNVDIFAPGNKIYATVPNSKYEYLQGTSMASPNVAGVAALIRSYYPNLTASQVKKIIMESGTSLTNTVIVGKERQKASFADVSKSGKIVNAYNAILMAEKMSVGK